MAQNPEAISRALAALVQPDARGRLLARGLARGMVWREGVVPEGGPDFPLTLTSDLLDFGYGVLAMALELRDANRERPADRQFDTDEPLRVAAESIESAVRRAATGDRDRGRHLVVCSAAFHLAGFAARSFSLLPPAALNLNLASTERALGMLLRRDLMQLRAHIVQWLGDEGNSDEMVSSRLLDENDTFDAEDAALISLSASYYRALGLADTALLYGDDRSYAASIAALRGVVHASAEAGNVPLWWVATLTLHLLGDLWDRSLHVRIPVGPLPNHPEHWEALRRDFIALLSARRPPHVDLWPSQLAAAARAVDPNDDLVIALPTSAGKTRIAELCILRALADGKRVVYVTPLRSLSAQIERVLARTFVPLGATVTSLYGASGVTMADASTLASAEIVVATPEKLDFALRQDASVLDDVSLVVFDEGHMIGLGSREIRYEVLIQRLLRRSDAGSRRIVCLSAMFNPEDPYFQDFGKWLRSDAPGDLVHVRWRPTRQRLATLDWYESSQTARLAFLEGERPFVPRFMEAQPKQGRRKNAFPQNDIEFCIAAANAFAVDGHNVLVYSPQRSQVEPLVRQFCLMSKQGYLDAVAPPKAEDLLVAVAIGREWLGEHHPAVEGLKVGVGTHHGALPRPFLGAVEELLDRRRLPVVVASPTLAQGIDLACSVLIFRSLQRYDAESEKQVPISPAEFANVVGRAGRAYVDLDGIAVLPTFEQGSRYARHELFEKLIKESRGQRLLSGLAQLIGQIARKLSEALGVKTDELSEYVLNQSELWADARLIKPEKSDADEDDAQKTLEEFVADLDVAILALVDPLDSDVDSLATLLDAVLKDSLWDRTLSHHEGARQLERAVLLSRSRWLWHTTSVEQRRACFFSGLGRDAGMFLHDRLDELVALLIDWQACVSRGEGEEAANNAEAFARRVMEESFFSIRKPPADWPFILHHWIEGQAFCNILGEKKIRDQQKAQAFVQEGLVFRLVWAAEAVRVQAIATAHVRADELGDGPALSLTYGVPSASAALLCQMGYASRVGAVWATSQLGATFTDVDGAREWVRDNAAILNTREFWDSDDQFLLWQRTSSTEVGDYPKRWKRETVSIDPSWNGSAPPPGTRIRLVRSGPRSVTVCSEEFVPLGSAPITFKLNNVALSARVGAAGGIQVDYFGQG